MIDRCLEVATFRSASSPEHHKYAARSFHPVCEAASLSGMVKKEDGLRQVVRNSADAEQARTRT